MGKLVRFYQNSLCIWIALVHSHGYSQTHEATEETPSITDWRQRAWEASERHVCPESLKKEPPLLVISVDGFRADYFDRGRTSALETLKHCGVHATSMRPVFPTKTFPNHYTIATGLYPESHGIIANHMFDPEFDSKYDLKEPSETNGIWWKGEPIWLTAIRQGKTSASLFWPGSDLKISGEYPSLFYKYNKSLIDHKRIDQVLSWLSLEENRPQIIMLYMEQIDLAGHAFGPDSSMVGAALKRIDNTFDRLMNGLHRKGLLGCINIVVVSDHGMQFTSDDRVLHPLKILDEKDGNISKEIYFFGGTGGRYRIRNTNKKAALESRLVRDLDCVSPHLLTLSKHDLPFRLHYSNSDRIESVITLVESGWQVWNNDEYKSRKGNHGYDNVAENMQAIFIAYGPAFKRNLTVEPFENIELYNLFCELTNLTPATNNGTKGALSHLLKQPNLSFDAPKVSFVVSDFPSDVERRERKIQAACQCHQNRTERFNKTELLNLHLPWGIPFHQKEQVILINKDYITSYDIERKQPRWIAFQLTSLTNVTSQEPCWMTDIRLKEDQIGSCTKEFNVNKLRKQGIVIGRFFQPNFSTNIRSDDDSNLLSNAVLMYENFRSDIFLTLIKQMKIWFNKFGKINVIFGPIFESSFSFHLATDFFAIFIRCFPSSSSGCEMDSLAFILPHRKKRSSCQAPRQFLRLNIARIRDVELKTGLEFFVKNQVLGLQQRLRLQVNMWETDTKSLKKENIKAKKNPELLSTSSVS